MKEEKIKEYINQIGNILYQDKNKKAAFCQNIFGLFYDEKLSADKIKSDIETYFLGQGCKMLNDNLNIVKKNKYFSQTDFKPDLLLSLNLYQPLSAADDSFNSLEIPSDFNVQEYVKNFFAIYFPDKMEEVDDIFKNKIEVRKGKGRSVATADKIVLYYQNKVQSVLTLAHEVSHMLFMGQMKCSSLKEVESMLTEEMFLKYLLKEKAPVLIGTERRAFSSTDILSYHQLIYQGINNLCFRMQKEMYLKELLDTYKCFTPYLLQKFANSVDFLDVLKNVLYIKNGILANYLNSNITYHENYDALNGKHLQNEVRFIYAGLVTSIFESKNFEEQIEIYKNYFQTMSSLNSTNIVDIMKYLENLLKTNLDFQTISSFYQSALKKSFDNPKMLLKN